MCVDLKRTYIDTGSVLTSVVVVVVAAAAAAAAVTGALLLLQLLFFNFPRRLLPGKTVKTLLPRPLSWDSSVTQM